MKRLCVFSGLVFLLSAFLLVACEEHVNPVIENYEIVPVAQCSRGNIMTRMLYGDDGDISEYQYYVGDALRSSSKVLYKAYGIECKIDSFTYYIKWDGTTGGSRTKEVEAYIDGGFVYRVSYNYDPVSNLLAWTQVDYARASNPYITFYEYNENEIIAHEEEKVVGKDNVKGESYTYTIQLSNEENTGNACNVFAFTNGGESLTAKYVFNTDLYYLNIYGKPIGRLPVAQTVRRSGGRLSQVGKFSYRY